MTREFSIYLNLVRFIAACLVIIYHSNTRNVVSEVLPLSNYGHAAVIVFFVLSGYVIAFVTYTKENTPREYWASRLSRIYSLAIPSLLLALLLDNIGETLSPEFYQDKTTHDFWYIRIISSLLFLNEIWGISIMAFSNVPYWSICYEMWYYVLFSVWFFMRGKARTTLIIMICLLLGPKILLLLPVWCLGVVLYLWRSPDRIPEWMGWACVIASVLLFVLFDQLRLTGILSQQLQAWIGAELHKQLTFSKFFLGDYLLGGIVMLNFIGIRRIAHRLKTPLVAAKKPVYDLSDYTFSLYIYHQPLLLFWAAAINGSPQGYGFYISVISATILSIWLLGSMTEKRRFLIRNWLRKIFSEWGRQPNIRRIITFMTRS